MADVKRIVGDITKARELSFGGSNERAVEPLKQATIYSGLSDGSGMLFGTSENRLGVVYRMLGRNHYPEAYACFQRVIEPDLPGDIKIPSGQKGLALVNTGDLIRVDESDNNMARSTVIAAIRGKDENLLVEKNGLSEACAWDQMGLIELAMGKPAKALKNYAKGREIAEYLAVSQLYSDPFFSIPEYGFDITDATHRLGEILHHIGVVYNMKGEPATSLGFQSRAAEIAGEIGHNHLAYNTTASVGSIHFEKGDYDQALEPFQKAIEMIRKSSYERGIAAMDVNMGCSLMLSGRAVDAEQFFMEAVDLLGNLSENDLKALYDSVVSRVESDYHGPTGGLDYFKAFMKKAYKR